MHDVRRHGPSGRLILALVVALVAIAGVGSAPGSVTAGLPRWTGGVDLYRSGVFTTQQTWLWCTAADVQIIRNIADRAADHSRASQQRYFDAMRAHNRYDIPVADGVDPAGWAYGLRRFVDRRYRLVASTSFDAALRTAVTNLRKTNLPVGITVAHGNHAWALTGFTATADPAATTRFTVTSVRVVGPLWGLQSRTYGYDMRPDTKLTPRQLAGFFTPWHYAKIRMAWEGRWVSIQPIGGATAAAPAATPRPTAPATTRPSATPGPTTPLTAPPALGSPSALAPTGPTPGAVALAGSAEPVAGGSGPPDVAGGEAEPAGNASPAWTPLVALTALLLAVVLAGWRRRGGRPRARVSR